MFELNGRGGFVDFLPAWTGAFEEGFGDGGFINGGFGGELEGFFGERGGVVEGGG